MFGLQLTCIYLLIIFSWYLLLHLYVITSGVFMRPSVCFFAAATTLLALHMKRMFYDAQPSSSESLFDAYSFSILVGLGLLQYVSLVQEVTDGRRLRLH